MNQDAFMRLVVTQLRETKRFESVEGRVISGIICIDVKDLDGQYFTNTTFCLGNKPRVAKPYLGDDRPLPIRRQASSAKGNESGGDSRS